MFGPMRLFYLLLIFLGVAAHWEGTVSKECEKKNEEAAEAAAKLVHGDKAASATPWAEMKENHIMRLSEEDFKNLKEKEFKEIMHKRWGAIWNQASLEKSVKPEPQNAALSVHALIEIRETVKEIVDDATEDKGHYHNSFYKNKKKKWDQLRMTDVNNLIVKPLASGLKTSLAHLMQYMHGTKKIDDPTDEAGQVMNKYVGPVTHFISHDWGGVFDNFVTSVEKHCEEVAKAHKGKEHGKCDKENTYYWVCTFANNQYGFYAGDGHKLLKSSPFGVALFHGVLKSRANQPDGIQSMLAIQCDGDHCKNDEGQVSMTMKRIWCVYEMALVISLELPLWWSCGQKSGEGHPKVFEVEKGTKMKEHCTEGLTKWMAEEQTPQEADVSVACDKEFVLKSIDAEIEDGTVWKFWSHGIYKKVVVDDYKEYRICDKIHGDKDKDTLNKHIEELKKKEKPYKKYEHGHMANGEVCLTDFFQKFAEDGGAPDRKISDDFYPEGHPKKHKKHQSTFAYSMMNASEDFAFYGLAMIGFVTILYLLRSTFQNDEYKTLADETSKLEELSAEI